MAVQGRKDKERAHQSRLNKAMEHQQLKKMQLPDAVQAALKALPSGRRMVIEKQLKESMLAEKKEMDKMREDMKAAEGRMQREREQMDEQLEVQRREHLKDRDLLIAEKKKVLEENERISALRDQLESQKRMLDADFRKRNQQVLYSLDFFWSGHF